MSKLSLICLVATFSVLGAYEACAQDAAAFAPEGGLVAVETTTPVAADAELAQMAGGTNTTTNAAIALTEQDLTAINTGNRITADTVTTGAITLGGAAFSNFNGVGNVIMNTGNNNNIQTSMSVTIVITP